MDGIFKWLADAINWVWEALKAAFAALFDLLFELIVVLFDYFVFALEVAIMVLPVPGFLENGLAGLFGALDPSVVYFIGPLQIPAGLALLGSAVLFRLVRKAVTLFQW